MLTKMCRARNDSEHNDIFKVKKPEKVGDCLTASFKLGILTTFIFSLPIVIYYYALNSDIPPTFFYWPEFQPVNRPDTDNSTTNISHIAFGIGGSTQTWSNRGHYTDIWWKPNKTRGFVFLDKEPDPETRFSIKYKLSFALSLSTRWNWFKRAIDPTPAERIAQVVVDLFRVGLPNVRWFVMGDDDTVFFTDNLVTDLSKYDHNEMVYVGESSESVEQNLMHGYDTAFGGGGFAISYPLAVELVRIFDGCLDRYREFYGSDQRIWACVGELGVGLSRESGFHQFDIRGDPYGILAAHPMTPLVSLHHLDDVKSLFPNKSQIDSLNNLMKAYEIDPSRLVQQSFCYHRWNKWSISVSWGYTVQLYPMLIPAKELKVPMQTFKTWRSWSDGPFTFNTRPMDPDPCKQPVIFYLDSAEEKNTGETVTTYKKFVDASQGKSCNREYALALAIEIVIVTAPKMDRQEWLKVPRRHCCEVGRSMANRTMKIRMRKCKQSETITI